MSFFVRQDPRWREAADPSPGGAVWRALRRRVLAGAVLRLDRTGQNANARRLLATWNGDSTPRPRQRRSRTACATT